MPHRKVSPFANSDFVMNQVFWIGVYPGLSREMLKYVIDIKKNFVTIYMKMYASSRIFSSFVNA